MKAKKGGGKPPFFPSRNPRPKIPNMRPLLAFSPHHTSTQVHRFVAVVDVVRLAGLVNLRP
jgi:hypothetical protein